MAAVIGSLGGLAAFVALVVNMNRPSNGETFGLNPPPTPPADEFVLAGMQVSCEIRITDYLDVQAANQGFEDSSPASRDFASNVVLYNLRHAALAAGESRIRYECVYDDRRYYGSITPLDGRPTTTRRMCRAYRETHSNSISGGRRYTSDKVACLNDHGQWEDRS
jgi:hypothetical protein